MGKRGPKPGLKRLKAKFTKKEEPIASHTSVFKSYTEKLIEEEPVYDCAEDTIIEPLTEESIPIDIMDTVGMVDLCLDLSNMPERPGLLRENTFAVSRSDLEKTLSVLQELEFSKARRRRCEICLGAPYNHEKVCRMKESIAFIQDTIAGKTTL